MRLVRRRLTSTQIIVSSFLLLILIGTVLLTTPMAAANGKSTPFLDALFTATSCVCVTGLVTVTTATQWSLFGHIVVIIMIQIGGLGLVALTSIFTMLLGKKLSLSSRMLLGDAFNLDTLQGLIRFLRRVFKATFLLEGIGALLYLPAFVPQYGWKGIWYSVFHSISAFCNAGIDIVSTNSFIPYVHNVWINLVTMFLIIAGGLGFVVWFDLWTVLRDRWNGVKTGKGLFQSLKLHTKLVLVMSTLLLVVGAVLYFIFEYRNPGTIGTFSLKDKILAACFQSVTTRTAGFVSIPQKELTTPSVIVTLFLMFTGGSPIGTAGGVKTTTIAIMILSVAATVRGQDDIICFRRRISEKVAKKALAVVLISFLASLIAIVALVLLEDGAAVDQIFEIYSALGTVGISRDYTATVGVAGKIILCICMYLGRIGPISMIMVFTMRDKQRQSAARLPEENVTVG